MIKWETVSSSAISRIGYDADRQKKDLKDTLGFEKITKDINPWTVYE